MKMLDRVIYENRQAARVAYALVAFGVFCLMAMSLPVMDADNTSARYGDMTSGPSSWTFFFSYRYIPGWINAALSHFHQRYFDFAYVWTVLFAAAVAWAVYEFCRLLRLPTIFAPFVLAAVGLHGYLTDVYQFAMIFAGYGVSMLGVAAALRGLRTRSFIACTALVAVGTFVSMISYQPFALIVPVAVGLILIQNSLSRPATKFDSAPIVSKGLWHPTSPWSPIVRGALGFVIAIILFVMCRHLLSADAGRAAPPSWDKIKQYLQFIILPAEKGSGFGAPVHERLFFGAILVALALAALARAVIKKATADWLAVLGVVGLLLIIPDPFNLLSATFWPTPRSLTATVFIQVGAVALLASLVPLAWRFFIAVGAVVLLILSGANQVQNLATQMQQFGQDRATVIAITAEIQQTMPVTRQTKLAVKSDWRNAIHLVGAVSTFDTPWSNAVLFPLVTGLFAPVPLPSGACSMPVTGPWRVERDGDVTVVCMK